MRARIMYNGTRAMIVFTELGFSNFLQFHSVFMYFLFIIEIETRNFHSCHCSHFIDFFFCLFDNLHLFIFANSVWFCLLYNILHMLLVTF